MTAPLRQSLPPRWLNAGSASYPSTPVTSVTSSMHVLHWGGCKGQTTFMFLGRGRTPGATGWGTEVKRQALGWNRELLHWLRQRPLQRRVIEKGCPFYSWTYASFGTKNGASQLSNNVRLITWRLCRFSATTVTSLKWALSYEWLTHSFSATCHGWPFGVKTTAITGNNSISLLLLCFLQLFVELIITMY